MIAKPVESITEADLQALIASRTPENRQLEYKQQLPDVGSGGNVKFLREVTAFANTQGGDLIYGMVEEDGIASALRALQMPSQDLIRQRLESLRETLILRCGRSADQRRECSRWHRSS